MHYVILHSNSIKTNYSVWKIVCVGRNYAEHAKELGNEVPEFPILFLKPPSALIHSGEEIQYPPFSRDVHHEVELVLLIGGALKNATAEEAADAIVGYGIGLDMTARDLQNELRQKGSPWTTSKCFDTSAVISEFVPVEKTPDILEEQITLSVNGVIRQQAFLKEMIFRPVELVMHISTMMKLERGDLIFTGTPKGVSAVLPGDVIEARLGELCSLTAKVK